MGIGREIARVRKARGLKQRELAERVPMQPSYLSEVETEKKSASFDTIIRIADVLDVSLDVLAGKELFEAAMLPEAEKAARYCKEDGLIRKSVLMMGPLDEDARYKIFAYIQDQKELANIRNRQDGNT
jgi:transcriptional regulator with XRE-family HTH domain